MKKFEEVMQEELSPTVITERVCAVSTAYHDVNYYSESDIVELSEGWVSPEDYQAVVKKLEALEDEFETLKIQLNDSAEELERLDSLEKKNESLKAQLEKPEIPQFVADVVDKYRDNPLFFPNIQDMSGEVICWLNEYQFKDERFGFRAINNKIAIIVWLAIIGYTVKEKLFYLKNKMTGGYIAQDCYNGMRETYNCYDRTIFTQQEIDSMDTGSYEQIEVE